MLGDLKQAVTQKPTR